jgi:hypothetical protein
MSNEEEDYATLIYQDTLRRRAEAAAFAAKKEGERFI